MKFNEFQDMMNDFRRWSKIYTAEQITSLLITDYLWDFNKACPMCDMGKFAIAVKNTLRC